MKWVLTYIKPLTARISAGITVKIIGTVAELIIPFLLSYILENVIETNRVGKIVFFGAIMASIICVGLQPVFETGFNLVTPSKLIELSNPNQPLLRRLMIETPGTYHHSMIVANLAEAAAEAIGADALLARVGAYYHDIGKLIRPVYFKENQIGENPHDKTDPRVSTAILTEHTRDGVELAKKHHLPEAIIDMICQHHGDTPVMYFYAKTVKQMGEENVDLNDFRYDGPKPQTAEAAILMLSDTVEAAVRSVLGKGQTLEEAEGLIKTLMKDKLDDNQLDNSGLGIHELEIIRKAFIKVFHGMYHERVAYPKQEEIAAAAKKPAEEKREEENSESTD